MSTVRLNYASPASSSTISASSTLVSLPSVVDSPAFKDKYLRLSDKPPKMSKHSTPYVNTFAGVRPFKYERMNTTEDLKLMDGEVVLGGKKKVVGRERGVGGKATMVGNEGRGRREVGVIGGRGPSFV